MLNKTKHNTVKRSTAHSQLFRQTKAFLKTHKILNKSKVVAISGGVDSVVLFFMMAEISKQEDLGLPLPVYISHQQRDKKEESKDIEVIEKLLARYELELCIKPLKVKKSILSEEQLRYLRYDALLEYAQEKKCECIVSGHHEDDQIENFFIRLFSGAHFQGLSGMAEKSREYFYKPFLNVPKKTLLSVAKDNDLLFNLDSSNDDTGFTRNHIRNILLPFLSSHYGNQYKTNILRFAQDAKDIVNHLKSDVDDMLRVSKIEEGCFLRKPLLVFSDLQLKFFFRFIFDEKSDQLNADQLSAMVHLLRKGEGYYSLTNKAIYKVQEDKISVQYRT
ncbi:tRNA lysidine(34) synthetase TilS [bacterium]|nr:tRNA lysidine(34) synthetase TilS [bacterium]